MLVRLAIAALAATLIIGVLIAALAFLSYRDPGNPAMSGVDHTDMFTTWFRRRSAQRNLELANGSVIMAVDEAPELLRVCGHSSLVRIDGYWQPTPDMVRELETRLARVFSSQAQPLTLDTYTGLYVGVVSSGRRFIYGTFAATRGLDDIQLPRRAGADGCRSAFDVAFDVETKAFGELRIDALR